VPARHTCRVQHDTVAQRGVYGARAGNRNGHEVRVVPPAPPLRCSLGRSDTGGTVGPDHRRIDVVNSKQSIGGVPCIALAASDACSTRLVDINAMTLCYKLSMQPKSDSVHRAGRTPVLGAAHLLEPTSTHLRDAISAAKRARSSARHVSSRSSLSANTRMSCRLGRPSWCGMLRVTEPAGPLSPCSSSVARTCGSGVIQLGHSVAHRRVDAEHVRILLAVRCSCLR